MPDSVAVTEVLWTLWGILGSLYVFKNLKVTINVSDEVKIYYKDDPHLVEYMAAAEKDVRHEVLRLIKTGIVVVSGILAMIAPPANPQVPVGSVQIIIVVALFVIVSIVVLQSFLDARYRKAVEEVRRNNNY